MPALRPVTLSIWLALASLISTASVVVVCGVGLISLRHLDAATRGAVGKQAGLLNDASAFDMLIYQKGFVAEYMVTRDPQALLRLRQGRAAFSAWLARMNGGAASPQQRDLLSRIEAEYAAYDRGRDRTLALWDGGQSAEARAQLDSNRVHIERILALCQSFWDLGRKDAEHTLLLSARSLRRLAFPLVATSIAGALASLAAGYLLARRILRPIYQLQLQVESATQRTRIRLAGPGGRDGAYGIGGLDGLSEHVAALVDKLEAADAVLVEQRRRLLQSEKLSAVGELAAKLAHEILNPLAGMKTAVQLLARRGHGSEPHAAEIGETAAALDREIGRVEDLVRRLVDYARPLQPRVAVCPVARILDGALEAAQGELLRLSVTVARIEEPGLPPLEVDPLLITQALLNLLCNAAQAAPGAQVELSAGLFHHLGSEHVRIAVADRGSGIATEHQQRLFQPFFTTKAAGHGLGLAVSQNILIEHGGQLTGENRRDGPGAIFTLLIPLVR